MNIGSGKAKRISRIFQIMGNALIIPIDDLLISGPTGHLDGFRSKVLQLPSCPITGVLGYPGLFREFNEELKDFSWIMNLTTSTFHTEHTQKRLVLTIEKALYMGADAVAVHVNLTAPSEGKMIQNLGWVCCEAEKYGIPVMAIIYVRRPAQKDKTDDNYEELRNNANDEYVTLVSHATRVAVEIGADLVKTNFTGTKEGFQKVVYAAGVIPVIIAGGEIVEQSQVLANASLAVQAGCRGFCFGRNTFSRQNIVEFLCSLRALFNE